MVLPIDTVQQAMVQRIRAAVDELQAHWHEMIRAEAPVLALAIAFTVGTVVSMVPVPVLDMMIAAAVMRLLHRLPRGPFMAAMAMWNSVVMAPVYAASPKVGGLVISTAAVHSSIAIPDMVIVRLAVGTGLIALGMALFSFLLATSVFSALRLQRISAAHS